jgi:hypothetical protein
MVSRAGDAGEWARGELLILVVLIRACAPAK